MPRFLQHCQLLVGECSGKERYVHTLNIARGAWGSLLLVDAYAYIKTVNLPLHVARAGAGAPGRTQAENVVADVVEDLLSGEVPSTGELEHAERSRL